MVTEGIIMFLFLINILYAIQFTKHLCCRVKRSKEIEKCSKKKQEERFKVFLIKAKRRHLANFFIIGVMNYAFMFIQSCALIFILIEEKDMAIRVGGRIAVALFGLVYFSKKMN